MKVFCKVKKDYMVCNFVLVDSFASSENYVEFLLDLLFGSDGYGRLFCFFYSALVWIAFCIFWKDMEFCFWI